MFHLLTCLMLVLTGWSAMAHVAEPMGGSIGGITFVAHVPGDGDEVPADADKTYPHHHSICHGHDVGQPVGSVPVPRRAAAESTCFRTTVAILTGTRGGVPARPPRA